MNLLRLSMTLFSACLLGTGTMWAQKVPETTGAHGFVETQGGKPGSGINIPEDRDGAVAGMSKVTTEWTDPNAVAVHYFHHPAAKVKTSMVLKVKAGKTVTFKVKVFDPENLVTPLATVESISVKDNGDGKEQEVDLVEYNFAKSGYYRYCIQCTSGCTDIIEISKFRHYSSSSEKTYKSGYLSSPSVHLNDWASTKPGAPKGENYDWCYHEVMMPKESDISGTYVMSMGLMNGYMGIQMNGYENGKSRHDIIFSIWDKGSTDIDPNLPDNLRAKLVDKNDLATNERFGNEGTGMKSFMAGHFWECGTFVQFITNCRKEVATFKDKDGKTQTQENTLVSAWFNAQDGKGWQYISTLRMPAQHKRFDSWYSFLENYNWPSGQMQRKGYYRNGYGRDADGNWYHFNKVGASHTDGERDAQGNEIPGKRYDYGYGIAEDCVGPNGEKAFFMTTGGFGAPVEGNLEVPLNASDAIVENIDLDVLLKRVDQAVANEKKRKEQENLFKNYQLNKDNWKIVAFSSEETSGEGTNGRAAQIIDGNDETYWHSAWRSGSSKCPHHLIVDMGIPTKIEAMEILMSGGSNRHIAAFELHTSLDGDNWETVYTDNDVRVDKESIRFELDKDKAVTCRYFKLIITKSRATDGEHVRINEISVAARDELTRKRDELNDLILQSKNLLNECGSVGTNIKLQTTDPSAGGYLSSNADQNTGGGKKDGDGLAALLDGNANTYFHSRWEGDVVNEPHYLQVDLADDIVLNEFKISYTIRNMASPDNNSPAPTEIKLQGSQGDNLFDDIAIFTKDNDKNGLPGYQEVGKEWTSDVLKNNGYKSLRVVVTKSEGPGKYQYENQYFFAMGEFRLLSTGVVAIPDPQYEKVNAELMVRVLKEIESAETILFGEATSEQLTKATVDLKALYLELADAKQGLVIKDRQDELKTLVAKVLELKEQYGAAISQTLSNQVDKDVESANKAVTSSNFYEVHTEIDLMKEDSTKLEEAFIEFASNELTPVIAQAKSLVQRIKRINDGTLYAVYKEEIDNINALISTAETVIKDPKSVDNVNKIKKNLQTVTADCDKLLADYNKLDAYYNGCPIKQTITGGNQPGFYSEASAKAYNEAYAAAGNLISAKNGAKGAYDVAYNTLKAANEGLVLLLPETGKFYTLRCAQKDGYATNHLAFANAENKMQHNATVKKTDLRAVWKFVPAENNHFKMVNLHTGDGVSAFAKGDRTPLEAEAKPLNIAIQNLSGQVKLFPDGGEMMHAQKNYDAVVAWGEGADSPSAWYIEEVEDMSSAAYELAVPAAGYADLYLNYDVKVPTGAHVYVVSSVEDNNVNFTSLNSDIIPAKTGVIVKAEPGAYKFAYSTVAANHWESLLKGCLYTQVLPGSSEYYYLFAVNNNYPSLYKAAGNSEVIANRVYLATAVNVSSFKSFFDGVGTGIDDVIADGEEVRIYDLQGRRVFEIEVSGIYLVNGKKQFVKKSALR